LAILAALIAALVFLIVLLLIGVETGPVNLLVGMVVAMLPAPCYVILLLSLDRYEPEPLWMLATAFFWGAIVAVFIAFILNTADALVVAAATGSVNAGQLFSMVVSAPIVEESAKAAILFIFFFFKRDEFDDIIDGIIYAGMVGLGFAMTENIQYYGKAVLQGGAGQLTAIFILRGMLSPFSHPLFTSMTGIGLGWSIQSTNKFIKWVMPVVGFALAMLLHGIWNFSAAVFGGIGFLIAYFMIMGPVLIATLVTIIFGLRREGRILRQYLWPDVQRGLLSPQEYEKVCTVFGRMGLAWNALIERGFGAWRARMHCNHIASELAFHRSKVDRGIFKSPQLAREREVGYMQTLQALHAKLRSA
jgi:RsiW-degrading membrane proteinase PrsW (M82 family)